MPADPLIEIHKLRNPELESAGAAEATPFYRNWLYDNSRAPFQLLLDFKTDGAELYPHVVDALQPLRDLGLLEYHNETSANPGYASIHARPIRITCTGKCPLELVAAQLPIRDIFFDAPLVDLASGRYNRAVSAMASAYWDDIAGSWGYKRTNRGQGTKLDKFAELSELARAQGMSVRVWDTPRLAGTG
ncbi:hypothetical protein Rhopal_001671-T1 [Rhodotorula paludigena]|uniref:Uncharacterized protein n=1 Tax=Rhodotorula paludigena TaxID=86838 RepID=A0AAV5GG23_9BASI|nr:hypothetical protein Rhopal_001671-T1 [Rhodotorula paludigena]